MTLDGTEITWLGHASFIVKSPGGKTLVFDPWLGSEGNPKCPPQFNDLSQWGSVDYIFISHGHFDHMGSAVRLAKHSGAMVIANFEIAQYIEHQGVEKTIGMNKGGTLELGEIRATMVHADHSSGISTEDGIVYGGEPGGYVVTLENGMSLYHAGDTNVFGDMQHIRALYAPDVCLLPIGGHFTMGPKEAAFAVRLLGPKVVIPMHYGTFDVLSGSPDALRDLLADDPVEVHVLTPGDQYR